MSHHPLYCSVNWAAVYDDSGSQKSKDINNFNNCYEEPVVLMPALEDLFYNEGIDVYFQAHLHNYERATPIYNNITVPSESDGFNHHFNANAPVYIVTGNAGNDHGHNDPFSETPADWSVFGSNDYGIGKLTAYNDTHLYWEYVSTIEDKVIDHLWITKDRARYQPTLA